MVHQRSCSLAAHSVFLSTEVEMPKAVAVSCSAEMLVAKISDMCVCLLGLGCTLAWQSGDGICTTPYCHAWAASLLNEVKFLTFSFSPLSFDIGLTICPLPSCNSELQKCASCPVLAHCYKFSSGPFLCFSHSLVRRARSGMCEVCIKNRVHVQRV